MPSAQSTTCSRKQMPSIITATRFSSRRSLAIHSSSCSCVAATKRRLTALRLVPRVVTPSATGSSDRAYLRVETPTTICSTARSVRGSSDENRAQLGSTTSSLARVRARGRFTLTRRPPRTSSPGTWPMRIACRSSCRSYGAPQTPVRSTSSIISTARSPAWITSSRSSPNIAAAGSIRWTVCALNPWLSGLFLTLFPIGGLLPQGPRSSDRG